MDTNGRDLKCRSRGEPSLYRIDLVRDENEIATIAVCSALTAYVLRSRLEDVATS